MGEKRMDLAEEMLHIEDVEKIASCSRRHIMDEIKKKKLWADVDYSTEAQKEQYYDLAK